MRNSEIDSDRAAHRGNDHIRIGVETLQGTRADNVDGTTLAIGGGAIGDAVAMLIQKLRDRYREVAVLDPRKV
jgi:hypothetical protein